MMIISTHQEEKLALLNCNGRHHLWQTLRLRAAKTSFVSNTIFLGRFEIGKLLGHGSFAKVYPARNVKTNEGVAIKITDKEKIFKI